MWVPGWTRQTAKKHTDAVPEVPTQPLESAAEDIGILPCRALGCNERSGIACEHIDRRGRLCATAWCPEHRYVRGDQAHCAIHGAPSAWVPAAFESAEATIAWLGLAAEDDIVSILNGLGGRVDGVVEAESVVESHDRFGTPVFGQAWVLCTARGVIQRIEIRASDAARATVELHVDRAVVSRVEVLWSRVTGDPGHADLGWLLREIVVPISLAVSSRTSPAAREIHLSGVANPSSYQAAPR